MRHDFGTAIASKVMLMAHVTFHRNSALFPLSQGDETPSPFSDAFPYELYDDPYLDSQTGMDDLIRKLVDQLGNTASEVKRHCERVAILSGRIAMALDLSLGMIAHAKLAGALHDIGKVNIPSEILRKPHQLGDPELRAIQEIPVQSASIARQLGFPYEVQRAILESHERPDGKGYPLGLDRERISMLARIVAVADCFDSLTNPQPYRQACSALEAIGIIRSKVHFQFDIDIANCLTCLKLPMEC